MTTSQLSYEQIVRTKNAGSPRLVVVEGQHLGSIFEVTEHPVIIGRDPRSTIVLDEVGVSRTHCIIRRRASGVVIADQGSKNGTYVNRDMITSKTLVDGDMIFLGQTTLKYLDSENLEHSYYEYLYQATIEDPVTLVPNRRYFDEFLVREIARTRRYGRPLSLLMLDLDHFKRVNDTYGHVCGDKVLREVSEVVTARLRQSEFLARYGGEEFALILPETSLRGAIIVAESIRLNVEKHSFGCGSKVFPLTVSIGVAVLTDDMLSGSELVKAADERLYEAKRNGRNKVVAQ